MPTSATHTYSGQKLEPAMDPNNAMCIRAKFPASTGLIAKGTILGEAYGTDELQKITVAGVPTGGTFTITFGGQTTAAIPYNAESQDIQAALEALSSVGNGNVNVYGGPLPNSIVYIMFRGALGSTNVAQVTTTDSFTGGSSPASTPATVRNGAAGTPGVYKAYNESNTDGSQFARAIAQYDMYIDGSGNITYGTTAAAGGEQGEVVLTAPVYFAGTFYTKDLTGLDANVLASPRGWNLFQGTIADGLLRIG